MHEFVCKVNDFLVSYVPCFSSIYILCLDLYLSDCLLVSNKRQNDLTNHNYKDVSPKILAFCKILKIQEKYY